EPWSQDLLDWLAYNFANDGNYDVKELIHLITTSKTYQLPSVGLSDVSQLTADDFRFTGMVRRRMTAEQFSDAVGTIVWPVFSDLKMSFKPNPEGDNDASSAVIRRASLVANNGFLSA